MKQRPNSHDRAIADHMRSLSAGRHVIDVEDENDQAVLKMVIFTDTKRIMIHREEYDE